MRIRALCLAMLAALLAACGPTPTPAPVLVPTLPAPSATPLPASATPGAAATNGLSEITPTPEASPPVTTVPGFDPAAWDGTDLSPFEAGLVPDQRGVLAERSSAPRYVLDVDLAADLASLAGQATVYYTNQEAVPLDRVWFHLHPNSLGGRMEVSAVTLDGASVAVEYAPDETALAVPLASPLPLGGRVIIQMAFAVAIPTVLDRNYGVLAYTDGVLALAHFYPMVAVYDDEGWNITPPAPQGDITYADMSLFAVTVHAPEGVALAATGRRAAESTADGRQTALFLEGPGRDFYLAASAHYALVSAEWQGVRLNSYAPAEHRASAEALLAVAAEALQTFTARYGPYPYTELDFAAIPTLALGIEYPGMIALNQDLLDPNANFGATPVGVLLESTTAHEVGHQWFYNLVGNDQLDEPWLDEALTQYATWRYYADVHGSGGEAGYGASLEGRWDRVNRALIPIGLPVSAYQDNEYGAIVYGRGPLFLNALAQQIGKPVMETFLRAYVDQYRWRIATAVDFAALGEATCQCELDDLFAEWVWE